ncbi:MAG: hypothetical protein ACRCTG_14750, partial [Aestuariivirga sp.]
MFGTARSLALASALRGGRIEEHIADLRAQIMDLQRQLVRLRAEAERSRTAMEQLTEYHCRVGEAHLCPWCWIELESASQQPLRLTGFKVDPRDYRSDEILNCRLFRSDWPVPNWMVHWPDLKPSPVQS